MRKTVLSSALFGITALLCRRRWLRLALWALSPVSASYHATLNMMFPGRRALQITDKCLAYGIVGRMVISYVTCTARVGIVLTPAAMVFLSCLGTSYVMFFVKYPAPNEPWETYHAIMHAVCATGALAFDMIPDGACEA
jgi:hypothetical protein